METIHIPPTPSTPEIILDATAGKISLLGRSIGPNAIPLFQKIFSWMEEYFKEPKKNTIIELKLEYFNSTSNKMIIDLLILAKKLAGDKYSFSVNWLYETDDEDLLSQGKEIEHLWGIHFEYIPY